MYNITNVIINGRLLALHDFDWHNGHLIYCRLEWWTDSVGIIVLACKRLSVVRPFFVI